MNYSQRTDLILPEYGRNIQQMVKHAVAIEDRAERTRCAKTIIDIMGNMFPYLRDVEGFKYKLWDHLAIMSEFKLDIDYPFEVVKPTTLQQKPEKIPYNTQRIRYMHYGRLLQTLIEKTVTYPEGERLAKIKTRLEENLKAIDEKVNIDRNRLEQELIFYIEKLDVNEEKLRLGNHLNYFLETMRKESAPGKKLGFIAQEMGREINTLGSKSNHSEMQIIVVQMKDELEQIKEQVLNVL